MALPCLAVCLVMRGQFWSCSLPPPTAISAAATTRARTRMRPQAHHLSHRPSKLPCDPLHRHSALSPTSSAPSGLDSGSHYDTAVHKGSAAAAPSGETYAVASHVARAAPPAENQHSVAAHKQSPGGPSDTYATAMHQNGGGLPSQDTCATAQHSNGSHIS